LYANGDPNQRVKGRYSYADGNRQANPDLINCYTMILLGDVNRT